MFLSSLYNPLEAKKQCIVQIKSSAWIGASVAEHGWSLIWTAEQTYPLHISFLLQSPHFSFAICLPACCYDIWWILCVWVEQVNGKGWQCWHWGHMCKVNLPEMWRSTTCTVYYSSGMSGSSSPLWLRYVWWHFHKKVIHWEFHRCWPSLSRRYGCQGWAMMGVGYGGVREWEKGISKGMLLLDSSTLSVTLWPWASQNH